MGFPERLRLARKAAGLTQAELAAAVRVNASAVTAWETGQRAPEQTATLLRLSLALGCSIDYLLTGHTRDAEEIVGLLESALEAARRFMVGGGPLREAVPVQVLRDGDSRSA